MIEECLHPIEKKMDAMETRIAAIENELNMGDNKI